MKEYDVVQAWLDNVAYSHSKNVNTGLQYRFGFGQFCKFIGKTPQEIVNEYEGSDEKQFRRKYAQLLRAHIAELSREGFAPNTIDSRIGAIKSFFKYNDLALAYVPTAKTHVVFHNRDITKDEIQNILQVSDPRDKAFFCIMAQSGLRPETLCNIRLKHIEPDFSKEIIPCKVDVPEDLAKGEYHAYFTFIGEESINYLKAYLTRRPKVTVQSYLFTNHGRETQANPKSFSRIFARTIQKLKEKGTMDYEFRGNRKPSEIRLYNLRKYFKKHAGQMGSEESEFLMGHKQGVRDHYLPTDPEHYRQLYKEKAMPFLRLETATATEHDKIIQEYVQKVEALEEKVKVLEASKGVMDFYNAVIPENVTDEQKQALKIFYQNLQKANASPLGKQLLLGVVNETMKEKVWQDLIEKERKKKQS